MYTILLSKLVPVAGNGSKVPVKCHFLQFTFKVIDALPEWALFIPEL
jgi:hypothetical protein